MKLYNKKLKSGFGILEMLLASSIFILLLMSVIGLLLFSRDSLHKDNLSSRASLLASEGLSAVESIRDRDFSNLVDGVYGLSFENNQWIFFEDSDTKLDFTRRVTISSISEDEKKVSVEVNWFKSYSRLGRVLLTRHYTNWSKDGDGNGDDDPTFQADFLIVEANNASALGFRDRTVSDIYLSNNGSSVIEIESIEVSWSGNPASALREVFVNSVSIWSGNISSTETAIFDIPYSLIVGNDPYNLSLRFQHSFSGRTINYITFNLSDGSSKTIENINL